MRKLKSTSYQWALTHLLAHSDTDLFPRPFELDALACFPEEVERALQTTDIGSYAWSAGRSTIVPKGELSFRFATQLDPWDSLVLTALIREFGDEIEQKRIPYSDEIVFSYRFEPMSDGKMYKIDADWPSFWGKSKEKAALMGGHVAIADVSSYYNQIYHHSLENQLQLAGVPPEAAKSVIRLCTHLTQGVSRGIPVGPHATHLLAECAFDPIDRNLRAAGYIFCRFVDDIHIFCKTRQQAQMAFYDLAEILDKQQKLSLQSHKSKILSADEFIEYADRTIAEAPPPGLELERDIVEVIDRYTSGDRYRHIDVKILSAEDKAILSQHNLEAVLNSYLDQSEPNFVRIRWLFRRLAQVGISGAIPLAVAKLEQFSPALADLASYLLSARNDYQISKWEHVGEEVLLALELPIIRHSEYLTVVLLDLFARLPLLNHLESILQKYRRASGSYMVNRKIIRAATAHHAHYWLRQRKEELPGADPWLRRALIAGASVFSKDERIYWLQRIEKGDNELEKFIARWAKTEK